MLVTIASLMVELVHMTWSAVPVRHTAPVCRSRTTIPRYPGFDLTRAAAASNRRCWSQPQDPHALAVADGAGLPGPAEALGGALGGALATPLAEPLAAGDPPAAPAHLACAPPPQPATSTLRRTAHPAMSIRRFVTQATLP
jgi:hypothetical protein